MRTLTRIAAVMILFLGFGCNRESAHNAASEEEFAHKVLEAQQPVLVDFYADWCGPCRRLSPVLERIAQDYIGKATLVKINVDHSPKLATRYQIQSVPTVILFVDGRAKRRWSGIQPEKTYRAALNEAIRNNGEEE